MYNNIEIVAGLALIGALKVVKENRSVHVNEKHHMHCSCSPIAAKTYLLPPFWRPAHLLNHDDVRVTISNKGLRTSGAYFQVGVEIVSAAKKLSGGDCYLRGLNTSVKTHTVWG